MRDIVLVSIDYDDKNNKGTLGVGRQLPNKSVDIVNTIDGPEAKELFEKLITKRSNKLEAKELFGKLITKRSNKNE